MAGKAPILLAIVLFVVGSVGFALSSAERASWGPFQPHGRSGSDVLVESAVPGRALVEPPSLVELSTLPEGVLAAEAPEALVQAAGATRAAPLPSAPSAPVKNEVPPIRVIDVAADDSGASAASAGPPPVPPVHLPGVAMGDPDDSAGQPPSYPGAETAPEGVPSKPD